MEKEARQCPRSGEPGLAVSLLDDGPSQVLLVVKNPPANARDMRRRFDLWVGKIPRRRTWQLTPVFLPGEPKTEEPSGLPSMGSQRVGGDSAYMHTLLGDVLGFPGSPSSYITRSLIPKQPVPLSSIQGPQSFKSFGQGVPEVGDDKAARAHLPGRSLWVVSAGPHLSMTGESRGCSLAAASVCGFSRGTTARSVSLCGAPGKSGLHASGEGERVIAPEPW